MKNKRKQLDRLGNEEDFCVEVVDAQTPEALVADMTRLFTCDEEG